MTSPSPDPDTFAFATVAQVANNWKPILGEDAVYCQTLLDSAGLWIRNKIPSIESSDPGAWLVSIQVVRDAMGRNKFPAIHSGNHVVDGDSDAWSGPRNATVEDLSKTLVFSAYHLQLLGLVVPTAPVGQFGNTLRPVDPIIVGGVAWPLWDRSQYWSQ